MRIIAGKYKSRALVSAKGVDVRPVTDRVKQVIFDVFQTRARMSDAIVIDAFAGTGSLGLEALSRGAQKVFFVEQSPASILILQKNISALAVEKFTHVLRENAMAYFERCKEQFDIIFADPPYIFEATGDIPSIVFRKRLLNDNGFLVIEHDKQLQEWSDAELFDIALKKSFGNTIVTFFHYPQK